MDRQIMKTSTKPGVRFVLVRNAQCDKHLAQRRGEFAGAEPGSSSVLTEEGNKMASAIGSIIEYLDSRPFCTNNPPDKYYHIIIDNNAQQHENTASKVRLTNDTNITIVDTLDISNITDFHKNKQGLDIYLVFTDAQTIKKIINNYFGKLDFGPALCSVTIFDYVPTEPEPCFLHCLGSLEVLQYGGYDASKLCWWNNAT